MNLINKVIVESDKFFHPQRNTIRDEERLKKIKQLLKNYYIEGDLDIGNLPITDLGNVTKIDGVLSLQYNKTLVDLGKNISSTWALDLRKSEVISLGSLTKVHTLLDLRDSKINFISQLSKLEKIGAIYLCKNQIPFKQKIKFIFPDTKIHIL